MSVYKLKRTQNLPITLEKAWSFFSNPNNLKTITPPSLGLEITSEQADKIYEGMIITYNVNPLPLYKTTWVTEITHINSPHHFIDEQRIGPYTLWHHQHFFRQSANGILMEDLIHYSVPYGYLGRLLNKLYIRKNLDYIFNYRFDILNNLFNEKVI